MATGQLGSVFRQIGRLFGPGTISGLTEAQLLSRFIERRDEAAFEALVTRFGPMVLGVCRQMLADPHAADDAFQATFLVLVKRARSIRDRDLLGNWLYGVALKVSRRARADLAKRRSREEGGPNVEAERIGDGPALDDLDLGPILHEELAKLPEKYRAPMVLCYLDGQTCEEAAGRLGWPVGTVKGRLSRAKDLLRDRLSRRGVTASAALVAATLAKAAEASVSPILLDQTVKAAMVLAAGGALATAGLGSAAAVALAEGVNTTMYLAKWKTIALSATLVATLAGGATVMARQGLGGSRPQEKVKEQTNPPAEGTATKPGTPTPANFEPWLNSMPLRKEGTAIPELLRERVAVAKRKLEAMMIAFENGSLAMDQLGKAVRDYTDARVQAAGDDRSQAIKALEDRVRFAQGLFDREKTKYENGQSALPSVADAELEFLDARVALARARSGGAKADAPDPGREPNFPAGGGGAGPIGPAREAAFGVTESDNPGADKKIVAELEKLISMPFANPTPLEEIIKYIRTATTGPDLDQGLPIYVDPDALEEREKTMNSPIAINLEGIKLKTSLRLALKQLGLGYYVKHGLIIVTSTEDPEYLDATQPGWRSRQAMMNGMNGMMGGGAHPEA